MAKCILMIITGWMGRNWFCCSREDLWSLSLLCCGLNQRQFQGCFYSGAKKLHLFPSSHTASYGSICLGWWQPFYKVSAKMVSSVFTGTWFTCCLPTVSSPTWPICIFLMKTILAKIMFLPGWKVMGREVVLSMDLRSGTVCWWPLRQYGMGRLP